jgi:hypothetical protein
MPLNPLTADVARFAFRRIASTTAEPAERLCVAVLDPTSLAIGEMITMTDAFFASLERQIKEKGLTEQAREENRQLLIADNQNFLREALPRIHKLVSEYDSKLQDLGYRSYMKSGPDNVQITLMWADNGHMDIIYKHNDETDGLDVFSLRSEPSQILAEPDVRSLNRSDWDPAVESAYLRDAIQAFTDDAEFHGGL